jgi:flagellar biosynthesis/type III secretory pathway M-ring protein FliF/YscJ
MQHAIAVILSAATTPTPTPSPSEVDPDIVTPGVVGFLVTAFVAIAVILLVWDMMRRIRRGRVRADIQEELDAEEQAARATEATETDDQSVDADSSDEPSTDDDDDPRRGGAPRA